MVPSQEEPAEINNPLEEHEKSTETVSADAIERNDQSVVSEDVQEEVGNTNEEPLVDIQEVNAMEGVEEVTAMEDVQEEDVCGSIILQHTVKNT